MSDIFGTQNSKATQAVIDAASKILMGVKDDETAAAQTESDHPIAKQGEQASFVNKEEVELEEKMSSKEKMKKGLYNQKGVMPAPKGMADKSPGDQDAGAKSMQKDVMAKKMKDQIFSIRKSVEGKDSNSQMLRKHGSAKKLSRGKKTSGGTKGQLALFKD